MMLVKSVKNRRKLRILLFITLIVFILAVIIFFNSSISLTSGTRLLDARVFEASVVTWQDDEKIDGTKQGLKQLQQQERMLIVPEKYDENKIKSRIIQDKIKRLKERQKDQESNEVELEHLPIDGTVSAVHIFYNAPIQWYKTKKNTIQHRYENNEQKNERYLRQGPKKRNSERITETNNNLTFNKEMHLSNARILNTAFYPALGLYKPTTRVLQQHFANIQNCRIGVLIIAHTGKSGEEKLIEKIVNLAPNYNLTVTFEFSLNGNQSQHYIHQQLLSIRNLSLSDAFYRVYSLSRKRWLPLLYISHAYKLSDMAVNVFCSTHVNNERKTFDALFVGHIKLKSHADSLRRLCFDGFYNKLPSNGGTFSSTWKNWSYLKSFAQTYRMLFIPTVGPGYAERNKFPRHGDIQRHRSNGRYYGVAWRTAIINHVGFISVASYNNWQDGSQIEEVLPKAGFLDYSPGSKMKYLDLTTHWVGNLWKARQEIVPERISCYELLNNTIC